ncbi:hypothetical protein ALI22I_42735 [Saccharothrix sp. ALI-22-I]|uniref:tripartite tricarboxylate transporter TctB family protein n=1 Tax=Saccharothrix sp. ALI-22-I TaxID=1933778 RepID=UPI00097CAC3B|nr:tripartite tricarboxylate transporter TctB family protein [Saccharothrix sp. ALI-22-I]ONI80136.1 hypothetical protein ALI22I_42735 [Saccharothrix sp. ALI-22-I]
MTAHGGSGDEPSTEPARETSLADALHEVEAEVQEYRPPAAGPTGNAVVAVVVLLLGIAALIGSWSLGVGSARVPDSGTWPLLVAVVLVGLGVALLVTVKKTSDAERFSRTSWLVAAGLATMVVFVLVIEHIGFEIPAALLAFVWLRFLGRESWRVSVVVSIGVVVVFYAVFVGALSVPIPHLF